MIEYIPTIWIFSALLIPVILIFIGVKNLYEKVHFMEVFANLFFTFLLYVPLTIFAFSYIAALINSLADAKGIYLNQITANISEDIDWITYGIFSGYIIFGLFLFWIGDGGLLKIINMKNQYKKINIFH